MEILTRYDAVVIGGGPAGLQAAETLAEHGYDTHLFEAKPTLGRKLLIAGKSGLNLTNTAEPKVFRAAYSPQNPLVLSAIGDFDADRVRNLAHALGIETFVGSGGKVFPREMKASPFLRAWLKRMEARGVHLHTRHRWKGWSRPADHESNQENAPGECLVFDTPEGEREIRSRVTILALGGASWPRLGSDGAWTKLLAARNIALSPLRPANMGFDARLGAEFLSRFAGQPIKPLGLHFAGRSWRGEIVISASGIEGSGIYPVSAEIRDRLDLGEETILGLDLFPDRTAAGLEARLLAPADGHQRKGQSWSNTLRKQIGLEGARLALVKELTDLDTFRSPQRLGSALKSLPLPLLRPRPIAEAISTAGGVRLEELDDHFMVRAHGGLFIAGEMLDWEAPTGGYLITGCLATGHAAALGAIRYLGGGAAG